MSFKFIFTLRLIIIIGKKKKKKNCQLPEIKRYVGEEGKPYFRGTSLNAGHWRGSWLM